MADLRFGVIGWGYWGPKIARNMDNLPHAIITMVADSDAHRLASLAVNQYQSWVRRKNLSYRGRVGEFGAISQ